MRVGQALVLRHADFVSRSREIRIVARPDNANGARAKLREAAVIPVSSPLVRLYSEYMHVEYGGLDSDYVFVNLFGGRVGQPLCYQTVHRLAARIAARTGIAFTVHMLRHTHATDQFPPRRPDRGRRPAAHAPVLDDYQPDLHSPGCHRRAGGPDPGRSVGRDQEPAVSTAAAAARSRPVLVLGHAGLDAEYASDHWNAARLGVPAERGRQAARFDAITQDWLRGPVKRWSRFRLATGCAFATISAGALGMSRFSVFLAGRHPGVTDETGITRSVLEDYLSWLLARGYSASTRALSLSILRVFSDACHRHGWLPGLAHDAVIYVEELPHHHDEVARFIPEFVMAQLESGAALDRLPFTTTRNLVVVLMETGLRGGDACGLTFSPMLDDSAGWPCLRFESAKVRAEQLIPLSAKAAAAIRSQQEHVLRQWPAGSPWLFPGSPATARRPTRTAPSASSSRTGSASSTCATRPASRSP